MNILITGGASGLGKAITTAIAKYADNKVYFTWSSSSAAAASLEAAFKNAVAIKCDFKNEAEVNSLVKKIAELDIDVLINNAYSGTPIKTYFHKIAAEDFRDEFTYNIMPTILITQVAINQFRKKKQGKIITILTSYLLNTAPIGSSSYVAGKAYLASLVKAWATENAKFNIASNAVSPSFMQTGLAADVDERILEQMKESHPLKKLLTVDEVAEAVVFLSNASTQINGTDLVMNAGVNVR